MSASVIVIFILCYLCILFWLAKLGDKWQFKRIKWPRHPLIYGLALGVYCTSWTFFGLVGTASTHGLSFLPILLGPLLLFTVGFPVLKRIALLTKQESIHSIADFISSRYGKRQAVAALVTIVVFLATVPYIALQLKAVSDMLDLTTGDNLVLGNNTTLLVAISMITFALLFGTKRLDVTGYHGGLMTAIAFESVVKFIALGVIALFGLWLLLSGDPAPESNAASVFEQPFLSLSFVVEAALSAAAIFCLPRMFHVCFVECLGKRHLASGRWIFSGYLAAIAVFVIIIASAGNRYLTGLSGDIFVLALPLFHQANAMAILAVLGGFSAATAMIIVATITLSQMLSNDVILPLVIHRQSPSTLSNRQVYPWLLIVRRTTVIIVVLSAYLYQLAFAGNAALTSIGLIAFALAAQLSPAIVLGLYWQKANAQGVYAGLIVGLLLWFYTLMIPLLAKAGLGFDNLLENGLLGIQWLAPTHFLNLQFSEAFTRGVVISLAANTLAFIVFSLRSSTTLSDRIQARAFCKQMSKALEYTKGGIHIDKKNLFALLEQFIGAAAAKKIVESQSGGDNISPETLACAERTLSGVTGVASARTLISTLNESKRLEVEDVVNIFGNTTKALRFNQETLIASFDNISAGISVVNAELALVAWNRRYEEMFDYPAGMLQIGMPVEDLVRFNAGRGLLGTGSVDELVQKRLHELTRATPYRVIRKHRQSIVIEIRGCPLPNGGYVTTYDDITNFMCAQDELKASKDLLEKRVFERTRTIESINMELRHEINLREQTEHQMLQAKQEAEEANAIKTKFLALASHDILQPLNAANLFAWSLDEKEMNPDQMQTLSSLRDSIGSAEKIMSTLLEISKLDNKALTPDLKIFSLDDILAPLISEYKVLNRHNVALHYHPTKWFVYSDPKYLRRILQNFLSNAIKYTLQGKILIGVRNRGDQVEIAVFDTGLGIIQADQGNIFDDFYRSKSNICEPGVGLGLGVAKRFGELLGHTINMHSKRGQGSMFSVTVTKARPLLCPDKPDNNQHPANLRNAVIMCVDDNQHNLEALEKMLARWSAKSIGFLNPTAALHYAHNNLPPQIILMDYQLQDKAFDGILLAQRLREIWHTEVPICVVSAIPDCEIDSLAKGQGFGFLRKPLKPAKLLALLSKLTQAHS